MIVKHQVYRFTLSGLRHVDDAAHTDRLIFYDDDDNAVMYDVTTLRCIDCCVTVMSDADVMLAHEPIPKHVILTSEQTIHIAGTGIIMPFDIATAAGPPSNILKMERT